MLDRWREVRRGASWGRSVISFLFTLKGLLRVLNPTKHSVNAAEVERATAFAEMSRSWTVKQNPFIASAWGRCWAHHACRCPVVRTDRFLVDDTDHHMHKLSSQCLLRGALGGAESWGTRACVLVLSEGVFPRARWKLYCWCLKAETPAFWGCARCPGLSTRECSRLAKAPQSKLYSLKSPSYLNQVHVIWTNVLLLNKTFYSANGETAFGNTENNSKLSNWTALIGHANVFLSQMCLHFFSQ